MVAACKGPLGKSLQSTVQIPASDELLGGMEATLCCRIQTGHIINFKSNILYLLCFIYRCQVVRSEAQGRQPNLTNVNRMNLQPYTAHFSTTDKKRVADGASLVDDFQTVFPLALATFIVLCDCADKCCNVCRRTKGAF